jgi:hypothetical protein
LHRAQDRGRDARGRRHRRGDVIREADHRGRVGGHNLPVASFPWRDTYGRGCPDRGQDQPGLVRRRRSSSSGALRPRDCR